MPYKKTDLERQALEAIKQHNLMFVSDVVAYLPCDRATFYRKGCNECDAIKEALEENRIKTKNGLRAKWYKSDNATVQIALYKLIGTEDEADRLNGSKQKISGPDGGPVSINLVRPNVNKPATTEDDIDDNI